MLFASTWYSLRSVQRAWDDAICSTICSSEEDDDFSCCKPFVLICSASPARFIGACLAV